MRTFAIGDMHGTSRALSVLLDALDFRPEDQLVTVGDYVDRGPDSKGVLDRLVQIHDRGQLVALRGNHEQMMLEARDNHESCRMWLAHGGKAAIHSYAHGQLADPFDLSVVPARHWKFLEEECVDWYETETHFFVHANVYYDIPLAEQPIFMLRWEPFNMPSPHISGKVMICGHTQQRDGRPFSIGHAICLDTSAYTNHGWLTGLHVESGHYWQANQRGETRTGILEVVELGDWNF